MNRSAFFRPISLKLFISITTQLSLLALVPIAYFLYPVVYVRLIAEDNWGEYATFVAFIIASCLFMAYFASSITKKRDLWYLLLAVGTFLVAMEEVSWGQRLVGFSTPEAWRSVNVQGETTLHNIYGAPFHRQTYLAVSIGFAVYGVVLPALSALFPRVSSIVDRLNIPLPSLHLCLLFVAPAVLVSLPVGMRGDEIAELFFGICLGCLGLERLSQRGHVVKIDKRWAWWLIVCSISFLIVWIIVSELVIPRIIESAYHRRSLQFLNDMISGQHIYPLQAYIDTWERISWSVPGMLVIVAVVLVAALASAQEPKTAKGLRQIALPLFVAGTVAVAVWLTVVGGSTSHFSLMLNKFAATVLPEAGLHKQAMALFSYLEKRPHLANDGLLADKARVLARMNRRDEAATLFRQTLALELERSARNPNEPRIMRRIARLHLDMGNIKLSHKYWNNALEAYDKALKSAELEDAKMRSLLGRAGTYEAMGEYDRAIIEYLEASKFVSLASYRNTIEWGVRRNLSLCGSRSVRKSRVPWNEIEAMAQAVRGSGSAADWCE